MWTDDRVMRLAIACVNDPERNHTAISQHDFYNVLVVDGHDLKDIDFGDLKLFYFPLDQTHIDYYYAHGTHGNIGGVFVDWRLSGYQAAILCRQMDYPFHIPNDLAATPIMKGTRHWNMFFDVLDMGEM